jgi:flagellin-like hook-associated protein FlgL
MALSNVALTAGMRQNLYSLQNTASMMDTTAERLATGKRVITALDDPINYFAAKSHEQRADDLSVRKDEMTEGIQTVKAANNGIEAMLDLIASAKSLAQSALSADTTTERTTLESQFNQLLSQMDTLADDSGYKGINLINSSTEELTVKFDETGAKSNITIKGFNATSGHGSVNGLQITNALTWDAGAASSQSAAIDNAIAKLDSARTTLRTEEKRLSTQLSTVSTRLDFTKKITNTLMDGAANLTLADMNEEGANMLMLQTRQSLATTSLSLSSQAAQSVLRLF